MPAEVEVNSLRKLASSCSQDPVVGRVGIGVGAGPLSIRFRTTSTRIGNRRTRSACSAATLAPAAGAAGAQ